jgi:radical SAM superfamily enzyme YgiQ (UPF0313 family)
MRILLVRPKTPKQTIGLKYIMLNEPLELEYIAAGVPGHEVIIADEILRDNTEKILRRFDPHIVGTSSYIVGIHEVLRICRAAKKHNPKILTVVGGVYASVVPEDLCYPEIDAVVCGEGIETFASIVQNFEWSESLEGIPGTALPDGNTIRVGPAREMSQEILDRTPFPRRDLTEKHRSKYYCLYHRPVTIMRTTIGCPYDCTFCFCRQVSGEKRLTRSAESIADEMETINTRHVYIVDDNFLLEPERLLELTRIIRKRGIDKEYLVYGRADFIADNNNIIRELSAIGLKTAIIGLEFTSDAELTAVMKHTSLEVNNTALEVLRRNNIDPFASFILDPDYGSSDFRRLGKYIHDQKLYYFTLEPLTPYPGTPIFKDHEQRIVVDRSRYPLWDLTHLVLPSRLTPRQFYWQMGWIYAKYTGNIPRALKLGLRTPPPVFSRNFLRLAVNAYRFLIALLLAHRQHKRDDRKQSVARDVRVEYAASDAPESGPEGFAGQGTRDAFRQR